MSWSEGAYFLLMSWITEQSSKPEAYVSIQIIVGLYPIIHKYVSHHTLRTVSNLMWISMTTCYIQWYICLYPVACMCLYLNTPGYTHTHTHTHIYMYIYNDRLIIIWLWVHSPYGCSCICIWQDCTQSHNCLYAMMYLSIHRSVFDHTQCCICSHTRLYLSIHCFVSYCNEFRQNITEQFFCSMWHWTEVILCYLADCWTFKEGPKWVLLYEWCLGRYGYKTGLLWVSFILHVNTWLHKWYLSSDVVRLVKQHLRAQIHRRQKTLGLVNFHPIMLSAWIPVLNLSQVLNPD